MQEELRALRAAERGTLTLAASTAPGTYVMPLILECFAEHHPRVDVDLVIGSSRWVAERVAHREVSLGLAGEVEWPDGILADPWLHDEVIGIAAPGRLEPQNGRMTAARLASETLLVREPGSSTRAVAERYLARVGWSSNAVSSRRSPWTGSIDAALGLPPARGRSRPGAGGTCVHPDPRHVLPGRGRGRVRGRADPDLTRVDPEAA
jgi:DNA-binding transcriptional LysR family regulator